MKIYELFDYNSRDIDYRVLTFFNDLSEVFEYDPHSLSIVKEGVIYTLDQILSLPSNIVKEFKDFFYVCSKYVNATYNNSNPSSEIQRQYIDNINLFITHLNEIIKEYDILEQISKTIDKFNNERRKEIDAELASLPPIHYR